MYKATSQNSQYRHLSAIAHDRSNNAIDESAFKIDNDDTPEMIARRELTARKMRLQADLSQINAHISRAINIKQVTGQRVSKEAFSRLHAEKARIIALMQENEVLLSEAKIAAARVHYRKNNAQKMTFHAAFFEVAKQMMADPVFERLVVAANHRMMADD